MKVLIALAITLTAVPAQALRLPPDTNKENIYCHLPIIREYWCRIQDDPGKNTA